MVEIPQATLLPIDRLQVDGDNPNQMTDRQHTALASSIEKYGFIIPIITNQDHLIADGEQRLTVAQSLGMKEVPVIALPVQDIDRRLLRQVLNKLKGEHQYDLDAHEFLKIVEAGERQQLQDLIQLTDGHLQKHLDSVRDNKPEIVPSHELDKFETNVQKGDIYQLGRHRLMCGDATEEVDVSLLTNNKKVDMVFIDPPYAIFGSSTGVKTEVSDDNLIKPFFRLLGKTLQNNVRSRGHIYVCCDWRTYPTIKQELEKFIQLKNNIVWSKGEQGYAGSFYSNTYENIAFFVNEPQTHSMFKSFNEQGTPPHRSIYQSNVWIENRVAIKERQHFAEKPISIITKAIKNSTVDHSYVMDVFGGSGSTLIACEQLNRTCYMMEIDPYYCHVIINRWEAYTGNTAVQL